MGLYKGLFDHIKMKIEKKRQAKLKLEMGEEVESSSDDELQN